MKKLLDTLATHYPISRITQQRSDLWFCTVTQVHAIDPILHLRDYQGFSHLNFITAVDYPEQDAIQLTYMLHNHTIQRSLGIRVLLNRQQPEMPSLHHAWMQVATYQRELKEMYGISFPGSPGLDDGFALEGWHDVPPMLRTFDTKKYSEETYFPRPGRVTHDPKTYMKQQLYPDAAEEQTDEA
jgi:NADH-quinone oxidoreductase subunit C